MYFLPRDDLDSYDSWDCWIEHGVGGGIAGGQLSFRRLQVLQEALVRDNTSRIGGCTVEETMCCGDDGAGCSPEVLGLEVRGGSRSTKL